LLFSSMFFTGYRGSAREVGNHYAPVCCRRRLPTLQRSGFVSQNFILYENFCMRTSGLLFRKLIGAPIPLGESFSFQTRVTQYRYFHLNCLVHCLRKNLHLKRFLSSDYFLFKSECFYFIFLVVVLK